MIEATVEELTTFREKFDLTKSLPANISFYLYQAALLLSEHLQWCAWNPHNPDHVQAVKDAICMQASTWVEAEVNPLSEGLTSNVHNVQSASLLGGSFTNAGAGVAGRKRASAVDNVLPSPLMILKAAGIGPANVTVVG